MEEGTTMSSRVPVRAEEDPRAERLGEMLNPYDAPHAGADGGGSRRGSVRTSAARLGLMIAAGSAATLGAGTFAGGEAHAQGDIDWGTVDWGTVGGGTVGGGTVDWGTVDWGTVDWGTVSVSDSPDTTGNPLPADVGFESLGAGTAVPGWVTPELADQPRWLGPGGWTIADSPDLSGLVVDGFAPAVTTADPPEPIASPEPAQAVPDPSPVVAADGPPLDLLQFGEPPPPPAPPAGGSGTDLFAPRASTFSLTEPGTPGELVTPLADASVLSPDSPFVLADGPDAFRAPATVELAGTEVTDGIDQAISPSPALLAPSDDGTGTKNAKFGKWAVRDATDSVLRTAVIAAAGKLAASEDTEATTPTGERGRIDRDIAARVEAATLLALDVVNSPETTLVAVGPGNIPVGAGGYQVHGTALEVTSLVTFIEQGNGVGSSLLQAMFHKARELNPRNPLMRLQAHPASAGFYRSVGGTITEEFGVTFVEFRTMPRRSGI
jgi:hypothetical protein